MTFTELALLNLRFERGDLSSTDYAAQLRAASLALPAESRVQVLIQRRLAALGAA